MEVCISRRRRTWYASSDFDDDLGAGLSRNGPRVLIELTTGVDLADALGLDDNPFLGDRRQERGHLALL
jgi:hypothetical protein